MITSDPDYEILATRITASNIQKRAANNFHIAMRKLHKAGIVTHEVLEVSSKVKDDIKPERDFEFGYFGLKTLEKGYLQKIDGEIIETPQYMYMRVAIGIHGHDIDHVWKHTRRYRKVCSFMQHQLCSMLVHPDHK